MDREPSVLIDLEAMRRIGFQVCEKRRWDMSPIYRMGYLVTEAAELCEAVRGKRGDPVEEAGDVLMCALVAIPAGVSLAEVFESMCKKSVRLMDAPRYPGEDRLPRENHEFEGQPGGRCSKYVGGRPG